MPDKKLTGKIARERIRLMEAPRPPDGLIEDGGTIPPETWSSSEFLRPILESIRD